MTAHDPLLRTRQVAEALGVSGSTIKRWVNKGDLVATRTVGMHRLIPLSEALRFAKRQGFSPESLEALAGPESIVVTEDRVCDLLIKALRRGDVRMCRALLLGAYQSGGGAVALADRVIRPVMERVGHGWSAGELDVYHEHQATSTVASCLVDLNERLARGREGPAPLAIGATPEGDPYLLSLLLGELALRELGWDVRNLGVNLPLPSLGRAVLEYRPRLVFLSVNHLTDEDRFAEQYTEFYQAAADNGVAVVLGGQALGPALRARLVYASFGERMTHLAEFAKRLDPAPVPQAPPDNPLRGSINTRKSERVEDKRMSPDA